MEAGISGSKTSFRAVQIFWSSNGPSSARPAPRLEPLRLGRRTAAPSASASLPSIRTSAPALGHEREAAAQRLLHDQPGALRDDRTSPCGMKVASTSRRRMMESRPSLPPTRCWRWPPPCSADRSACQARLAHLTRARELVDAAEDRQLAQRLQVGGPAPRSPAVEDVEHGVDLGAVFPFTRPVMTEAEAREMAQPVPVEADLLHLAVGHLHLEHQVVAAERVEPLGARRWPPPAARSCGAACRGRGSPPGRDRLSSVDVAHAKTSTAAWRARTSASTSAGVE